MPAPEKRSRERGQMDTRPAARKMVSTLGAFAAVLCVDAWGQETHVGQCSAGALVTYICGPQNVEDLIRIEGTDWVLASQFVPERAALGGFYLINTKNGSFSEVAPDFSAAADPIYRQCPGAPKGTQFAAHGISIRRRPSRRMEVYAVNHGGRNSIEVFSLDVSGVRPRLTWRGCVVTPEAVSPNSVTYLPGGGFAVTSFGDQTDQQSSEKILAGKPIGFVIEWLPATGWAKVPGTEFAANNGIVASEDGKTLFVTGWGDGSLNIVSRAKTPLPTRMVKLGDFHPDNIRYAPDGSLLITGQVAEAKAIFECGSVPVCTVAFRVVRVDPKSLMVRTVVDALGSPEFGGATSAIVVGDQLWLGTFRGNRIARFKRNWAK